MSNKITNGLVWKLLERFGVFGVQFILQIVLARLLDPSYYGMLTVMNIFVTLANVFVQTGFNTSLVQNKDVTKEDYSSVFWVSLFIAVLLYGIIFISAPFIASFYKMPQLVSPLRVLGLILIPGALNSVQLAKVSREMNFKKVFISNIGGALVSGIVGITCAYKGFGLWALVIQSVTNVVVACIVMFVTVKWVPQFVINLKRVKILFSYGWKLLVSALIDTLYNDLSSLLVGKKYNASTLGYYNRGLQFPQVVITPVNNSIQSVLLPAMSEKQEEKSQVKYLTRRSVTLSSFIIFPLMAGLAGVAQPLIKILLTDKWLPCVPFLQLFCISYGFFHVHSCNLQAINAMGRSDVFLKLEIIKKTIGIAALAVAVFCFNSPVAIAVSTVLIVPVGLFVNCYPNKKLMDYGFKEQMLDILPPLASAVLMFVLVYLISLLNIAPIIMILIQVIVGIVIYFGLSLILKSEGLLVILNLLKGYVKKK